MYIVNVSTRAFEYHCALAYIQKKDTSIISNMNDSLGLVCAFLYSEYHISHFIQSIPDLFLVFDLAGRHQGRHRLEEVFSVLGLKVENDEAEHGNTLSDDVEEVL